MDNRTIEQIRENEDVLIKLIEAREQEIEAREQEIERLNNIINELNWKPIKEYDESNYDWVLVKYFDGNYECVPIVAEKRFGKWYSSEGKEIKFKIKYFFDMQQLDKLLKLKKKLNFFLILY